MTELSLRFVGRSEIGMVRKNNEDSGYATGNLLVVADGMGGHSAGELASAATVVAVVAACENSSETDDLLELLANAVVTSGEYIADVVASNRELTGMGTTLTAIAMRDERIAMAHVGDSRAYLIRDGELQQITKDHTYVQSLVDSGQITLAEAAVHPRRNLLMRAIDGIHAVDVDLSVREARLGDRYLLCSDGLCGVVSEETITAALENIDLTGAVTELIEAALAAGAPDNVTVIVADVVADGIKVDPVLIGAAIENETQIRLPEMDFPSESIEDQSAEEFISGQSIQRSRRVLLKPILLTVLTVAGLVFAGGWWLANQWYVAEYQPTKVVAIYQGIPTAGLSRLVAISELQIKDLPAFEQQQISATIDAATRQEASASIDRLRERSKSCNQNPKPVGCGELIK